MNACHCIHDGTIASNTFPIVLKGGWVEANGGNSKSAISNNWSVN